MSRIEGTVATARADRYLSQIVEHLSQIAGQAGHEGRHGPPAVVSTEHTGDTGRVTFAWGTCTLLALPDRLALILEGGDLPALEHATEQLRHRIETIGRRDGLTVVWEVRR